MQWRAMSRGRDASPWSPVLLLCSFQAFAGQGAVPIMPLERYASLEHDRPYVLKVCTPAGRLQYVGIGHTRDAGSETVRRLREQLDELQPQLILVEGPVVAPKASLEESVSAYGEPGALLFLGQSRHIPVASLDMPVRDEMALVARKFGGDRTATFYGLRMVAQETATNPSLDVDALLANVIIPWLQRHGALGAQTGTTEQYKQIANRALPTLDGFLHVERDWFDPLRGQGTMGDIARYVIGVRDEHMLGRLLSELREGRRVLAEAGSSHVVMQEPAILARLGCPAKAATADRPWKSPSVHVCGAGCGP
jgi:hypothetical protein